MSKRCWMIVMSAALMTAPTSFLEAGLAQTCASNCGDRQIQFTPGLPIRLEMVNRTSSLIQVEQVVRTSPIAILPGQVLEIDSRFGTEPNTSVVFWDETALAVRAVLFRPSPQTLRVEILPDSSLGDRSIYIQNDGTVAIF
jgi:hypothetical protein